MKMRALRPVLLTVGLFGLSALILVPPVAAQAPPQAGSPKSTVKAPSLISKPGTPIDFTNPQYNGLTFQTAVGSFKLLGSDPQQVEGKLDINFKGTVLISDLEPGSKVVLGGDVRQEYQTDDKSKVVYFGKGKMTVVGRFRAIQFFGQNLSGHFFGWGIFRLYGEFDKNLNTGWYQLDGGQKFDFGTGGTTIGVSGGGAQGKVKVKKIGD